MRCPHSCHSESYGADSLFVELRRLRRFGFLCVSDFYPHPPASTQQGISFSTLRPSTAAYSPMLCCSPSRPTSPMLFTKKLCHRPRARSCVQHFSLPHRRDSSPGSVSVFLDVTQRLGTILALAGVDGNSFRKSIFWIILATSASAMHWCFQTRYSDF